MKLKRKLATDADREFYHLDPPWPHPFEVTPQSNTAYVLYANGV